MSVAAVSGTETAAAHHGRARHRLLAAARCRYAEDRFADAVSAGARQLVLFGSALDTFEFHNPYREVRIIRVETTASGITTTAMNSGVQLMAASGFDTDRDTFAVHLDHGCRGLLGPEARPRDGDPSGDDGALEYGDKLAPLTVALRVLGGCRGAAEIVFTIAPEATTSAYRLLRDTGWSVLEEVDAPALASRYLTGAPGPVDSREPRLVRARVGNNAGRLPNSPPVG